MPEDKPKKSEIDRLKELVRKSGFPLQIEIASRLYSARTKRNLKEMEVSTGMYYLDKDENKGRELDITARIPIQYNRILEGKSLGLTGIDLSLLIQCKRMPGNAWVFFKTSQEIFSAPLCTSVLDTLDWTPRSHWEFAFLLGLHYEGVIKTTLYDEYVLDESRSNKKVENLFEAVITLAKAVSYRLDTTTESLRSTLVRFANVPDYAVSCVNLCYPVVVFDGKMYLAEETGLYGEMNPVPIDHVCLFFDFVSGNYRPIQFYVDIVQREAFDRFFDKVANDVEILKKALEGSAGIKFRKEVAKALSSHRMKEAGILK